MWCPGPYNPWTNSVRICHAPCCLPSTAVHHGILLRQYLQGRKETQHSLVPDVSYKYRKRNLAFFSKADCRDYFHYVYCVLFLLDTLFCLHGVHDGPTDKVPGWFCAELWPSFVLVRFSKQLRRSFHVWSQKSSHKEGAVLIVRQKISKWRRSANRKLQEQNTKQQR